MTVRKFVNPFFFVRACLKNLVVLDIKSQHLDAKAAVKPPFQMAGTPPGCISFERSPGVSSPAPQPPAKVYQPFGLGSALHTGIFLVMYPAGVPEIGSRVMHPPGWQKLAVG